MQTSRLIALRSPMLAGRSSLRAAALNGIRSRNINVHPNPLIITSKDQLWYKFHNTWPVTVPMTMQLPGTTSSDQGVAAKEPVCNISKLSNGVRVISETSHGLGCSLAVFLQLGSAVETAETSGATHYLQHLAFKATKERSHFMLTRDVEKIGGHVASGASRDVITYAGECLSSNAEKLFEIIAETATRPSTESYDMKSAANLIHQDVENSTKNGASRVLDLLHEAAYAGEGLGAPLLTANDQLPGSAVDSFLAANLVPARIVVAGVGIEHSRLAAMAEKAFGELAAKSAPALPSSKYVGGDYRVPADLDKGEVHIALGFQGVGVADKDLLAVAAIQSLLGGGDSFSAGGPGKGLTSRIFTNVLSLQGVLSSSAFSVSYHDSGLFGVQTSASPDRAAKAIELVCRELVRLRKDKVTALELERAVNQTRASLLTNLEAKGIVCEDLGRQLLYFGQRQSGAELSAKLAKLTADDISRAAGRILASPLTVSAYGAVQAVPPYEYIQSLLK